VPWARRLMAAAESAAVERNLRRLMVFIALEL
jgi:hypothetical protein